MPFYNSATVATALDVDPKWMDNILSHNDMDRVQRKAQGVSRRLSISNVIVLSLTKELAASLRVSSANALQLATAIVTSQSGNVSISPSLRLVVDLDGLRADMLERLEHAVEVAPSPRRGRPPKR